MNIARYATARPRPITWEPPWVEPFTAPSLPSGWHVLQWSMDGVKWARHDKLTVILSGAVEEDGKRWIHVSCARPARLPSWDDMKMIKTLCLGDELTAVQVFVPKSRWISIHDNCLHLFACLDGPAVPDFARGGDSI